MKRSPNMTANWVFAAPKTQLRATSLRRMVRPSGTEAPGARRCGQADLHDEPRVRVSSWPPLRLARLRRERESVGVVSPIAPADDAPAVEGDRDGAGEVLLSGLRDDQTISQVPAPFHVIPRGWAGPSLLAMIVFEKFGQHQPGRALCAGGRADRAVDHGRRGRRRLRGARSPPAARRGRCQAAERLHGDDTTVPVLAKGKTDTGRLWVYLWTVPAMQGLLRHVGKRSVAAIYSVFGATSLLTLMRYADWRPITLAGFLSPIDPAGLASSGLTGSPSCHRLPSHSRNYRRQAMRPLLDSLALST